MIRFYFAAAPNPAKVALMLEETGRFKFKTEADAQTIRHLYPTMAAVTTKAG
jgi:hypothetical protein